MSDDFPDHPPKRPYLYNQWSGSPDTRDRARELRTAPTDAERKLWTRLRRHSVGGYRFPDSSRLVRSSSTAYASRKG